MAFRITPRNERSRARARAPALFVSSVAALLALGPAAVANAASAEPDADCDGIANASDKCPTDVEDRDGHADEDGCPDPDNDGDLMADATDKCPDEAEIINDFEDTDGCPDSAIVIKDNRIELKQNIYFEFNDARIMTRSHAILSEIALVVREHPEIGVIEISGHTDDVGSARYNRRLSARRAGAVEEHLYGLGVEPSRLKHVGRGESDRKAPGKSEEARAQNRRVEFAAQFAFVQKPADTSVRDTAKARAAVQGGPNFDRVSSVMVGCTPMSLADSEASVRVVYPVAAEVASVEPIVIMTATRAMSLTVGGGVTGFIDDEMRSFTETAGSWEGRLTLGTRQRLAIEASYLGSVQSVETLGLDEDAVLISNGVGGALRLNALTGNAQPYVIAGAAWRRYDVVNDDFNTSSMNDDDNVLETPVGLGLNLRYGRLILDARGVYRRVFYDDLIQTVPGQDEPDLHNWNANLMGGFEF
jgi:outer membrane protein OmpA-like peptidoglycan-associated protein